jgi:hypothetical protein
MTTTGDRASTASHPDRPAVVESVGSPQPTSDGRATTRPVLRSPLRGADRSHAPKGSR